MRFFVSSLNIICSATKFIVQNKFMGGNTVQYTKFLTSRGIKVGLRDSLDAGQPPLRVFHSERFFRKRQPRLHFFYPRYAARINEEDRTHHSEIIWSLV